jgi:CheY-like chemotaxis protein
MKRKTSMALFHFSVRIIPDKVADLWNRCGPQKLARVIHWCLRKLDELGEDRKDASTSAPVKTQVYNSLNKWRPSAEIKNVRPLIDEPAQTSGARNGERFSEEKPQKPEVPPDRNLSTLSTTPTDRECDSRPHLRSRDKTYSTSRANTIDVEVPETAHEKPRILLVDDNYINLKLLVTFVRKAHYPYECATDGLQAVEAYKRASGAQDRAFRYVLMDISMPVMDGMAATREIRDFEKKNRIEPRSVIIALTGLASGMARVDALHSGINYFQVKPIKFKDLLKILEY